MDFAILVMSILFGAMLVDNLRLRKRNIYVAKTDEENAIEKRLNVLSAERLKIKNDVDRIPLDELVNRKRDGNGDNS